MEEPLTRKQGLATEMRAEEQDRSQRDLVEKRGRSPSIPHKRLRRNRRQRPTPKPQG